LSENTEENYDTPVRISSVLAKIRDQNLLSMSQDSSIGIAIGYGLDGGVSIPDMVRFFSLFHIFQTGSGAHPDCHAVGKGSSFPVGKAAGA
jgi:hypothetical protein